MKLIVINSAVAITVNRSGVITSFPLDGDWATSFTDAIAFLADDDELSLPTGIDIVGQDYEITKSITFYGNNSTITANANSTFVIKFSGLVTTVNDLNVDCNNYTFVQAFHMGNGQAGSFARVNRCTSKDCAAGGGFYLFEAACLDYILQDCYAENPGYACFRDRITNSAGGGVGVLNNFDILINIDKNDGPGENRFMTCGRQYGGSLTVNGGTWTSTLVLGEHRVGSVIDPGESENFKRYLDDYIVDGLTLNIGDTPSWFKITKTKNIEFRNVTYTRGDATQAPEVSFGYSWNLGNEFNAEGVITIANPVTINDSIQIGTKTYTFVAGSGSVDGEIGIGADVAATRTAVSDAVNGTDGHNTANDDVRIYRTAGLIILEAIVSGSIGNVIPTVEVGQGFTDPSNGFDGVTLGTHAPGLDPTFTMVDCASQGNLYFFGTFESVDVTNSTFGKDGPLGFFIDYANLINIVTVNNVTCSNMNNRAMYGGPFSGTYVDLTFNFIKDGTSAYIFEGPQAGYDFRGAGITIVEGGTAQVRLSNSSEIRLVLTKDLTGDYHFDETLGTPGPATDSDKHPAPPFTSFTPLSDTELIINENYGSGNWSAVMWWYWDGSAWVAKSKSQIIFPRVLDLDTGHVVSPPWTSGVTGWANGGTIYRGDLDDEPNPVYDTETGDVIPANLPARLANLPAGALCSVDIEAFGYNGSADTAGQRQFDMMIECRAERPDCLWGYYSSFARSINSLTLGPLNENWPSAMQQQVDNSGPLAGYVDFLAPALYTPFVGVIKDEFGNSPNGVPSWISDNWPNNSSYGFPEWSDMALQRINMCKAYGKPVYPYMSPYVVQMRDDGTWNVTDNPLDFPYMGFWGEAVDFILENADGMIYFDLHTASGGHYTIEVEEEITAVLQSRILSQGVGFAQIGSTLMVT